MRLESREWKPIPIGYLFNIKRGNAKNIKQKGDNGSVALVSAIDKNNGLLKTTMAEENERICRQVYTINNNGNGVCLAYYHKYDFIASSDVSVLEPKFEELKDEYIAHFIVTMVRQQKSKYNYGYKMSNTRMNRQAILLPVTDAGKPDYAFMYQYIKQKSDSGRKKYLKYVKERINELGRFEVVPRLSEKTWLPFSVSEIFEIKSGKRLESNNMVPGNRPFIGACDSKNGITNYVSNVNSSLDHNVLGVNYNGNGMVISFYHPYECLFSDDVKRFHLKQVDDNKFVLLFMKNVILQQKSKYNYGYKFNAQRMARQKIMLPVNKKNMPDYVYMEQYIKNQMIRMYSSYAK